MWTMRVNWWRTMIRRWVYRCQNARMRMIARLHGSTFWYVFCLIATGGIHQRRQSQADEFVLAHVLGWWGKAIMLRDYWICWVISIAFELLEYSLQHQLYVIALYAISRLTSD
jgi:hypothetical protein